MEQEIWKPIPNYEGLYEASNLGNIRSVNRTMNINNIVTSNREPYSLTRNIAGQTLKKRENVDGYYIVDLSKNGVVKRWRVHRLVAMTFIDNPDNKPHINHKDSNRKNNCIDNLEWCTSKENNHHAASKGHYSWRKGMSLTDETKQRISKSKGSPIRDKRSGKEYYNILHCARELETTAYFIRKELKSPNGIYEYI